jgi:Transglycosylase SLT domain
MRRPNWRTAMFVAASGMLGLTILAGCSSRQTGLSASDQASWYLRNARGRYVVPGPANDPWGPYIREASQRFDMPVSWIRALMRQESGGQLYQNGRLITSGAGAMGLMQVMPGTYAELRTRYTLGPDPYDPHDNIMAGVAYMREMYDMYGSPGFLAAYNAGPNRLDDYLSNQRGLPDETRRYVAAIAPSLRYAQPHVRSPAQQFAMNQVPVYIPPGTRFGSDPARVPTIQMASLMPVNTVPIRTVSAPAAVRPAPAPRAVAWAAPPPPPVRTAPAPEPRTLAWTAPPRQTYAPIRMAAAAEPERRAPERRGTVLARAEERRDESIRVIRAREATREPRHHEMRLALDTPPAPPAHRNRGGFHLISAAMAAETITIRRGRRHATHHVSYTRSEHEHRHEVKGSTWKLRATGPKQACRHCGAHHGRRS